MKYFSIIVAAALGLAFFAPASAAERQITIAAKNYAFVPGTITLQLNKPVKLRFIATQGYHGIAIPEIGLTGVVNIGPKATIVEATPKKIGVFTSHCAVMCGTGHANMILHVKVVK
jgi:cytochrome c oxidase subunit 2